MTPDEPELPVPQAWDRLEAAAHERLQDARVLFEARRFDTAINNGLYALEITLKARICRHLDLDRLPDALKKHDLELLLNYSGLGRRLKHDSEKLELRQAWQKITNDYAKKLADSRYDGKVWEESDAIDLFDKLGVSLESWLPEDGGLLSWIRSPA